MQKEMLSIRLPADVIIALREAAAQQIVNGVRSQAVIVERALRRELGMPESTTKRRAGK